MRKVRDLPTVDYGVYAAKQSNSHPGSGPNGVAMDVSQDWVKSQLMWLHTGYAMTVPVVDTAMAGREVFESTTRKRPQFNECYHTFAGSVNYLSTYWWLAYGASRPSWSKQWRFKTPAMTITLADAPDFNAISLNTRAEAYHTMIPRFEGDISMVNFIFEMKDFRDISNLLSAKTYQWMNKLGFNAKTLSAGTKRAAELHLTNNFVIEPLAADLSQLFFQAQKLVMDVQEEFRKRGEQPNIRHFSKQLNQSQSFKASNVLGSAEHIEALQGSKGSSKFTATMEGDYGYQTRGNLDAFLKYWGLQLTAEAVWNGLPFSFLADYFISFGHSLNVMRHDPNVKYHVRQYCESLLNEISHGIFIRAGTRDHGRRAVMVNDKFYELGNNRNTYLHTNGVRSSSYSRRVTTPYWGPFLPEWKIPSGKQALNMAALLRCLI